MSDNKYRVDQLTRWGVNGHVHDYESLETHHPVSNRNARMVDSRPVNTEAQAKGSSRDYAIVDGEFEEVLRAPERGIKPGQTLVSKDFILSNDRDQRAVDVLSPVAGYVGRVDRRQGLVDIYDREGGDVIARIRHMEPPLVKVGDTVEYGQAVGVQGNAGTKAVHAHMDVDVRYLSQFKGYVEDLTQGRLLIDPAHRRGGQTPQASESRAQPSEVPRAQMQQPVLKLHAQGPEVRGLQTTLRALGYSGADGLPLKVDSDFGHNTDHAVRAFQRAHGLEPVDGKVGKDTRAALVEVANHPLVSEATHPNHKVYQAIASQLPPGTDPKAVANVTMQAQENGVTKPAQIRGIAVTGSDVHIAKAGNDPGDRFQVDLRAPTADLQAMSDHMARQARETAQSQPIHPQAQQRPQVQM